MLQSLLLVLFARVGCHSVHGVTDQTEEYTVWPKDNASRLPEDYPWISCDKTTGSQCPGLIDYLEHFCTREDNQGCQKRNESVSERHVLLDLLPGQHKMDLWESFQFDFINRPWHQDVPGYEREGLRPGHFWFCWVSITFSGSKVSQTTISLTNPNYHQHLQNQNHSLYDKTCNLKPEMNLKGALWSACGFRGGGGVRFQDIVFETEAANPPRQLYTFPWYSTKQAVITVWDIAYFEMVRCRFPKMLPTQAAVVVLYSKDAANVSLILKDCDFHTHFSSSHHWPRSGLPFLLITSTKQWIDDDKDASSSRLLMSNANLKVSLERCTFISRCMKFSGLPVNSSR